jgi:hypothetical protein
MNALLMPHDEWSITSLASNHVRRYRFLCHIADNDLGGSNSKGATAPPLRLQALFLRPHSCVMAGCAGAPSGASGSFTPIRQSCATRHPSLLGGRKEWLQSKGATPMEHALIPSAIRAFAHRRMALSALRANSSLSVRLTRYNAAMAKARALGFGGGVQ